MDHRCLYGHRIPETFTFAIQQRSCPTCGAPSVTVEGYQLARHLTEHVRLEAMAAFNSVRFIEERYNLAAARLDGAPAASATGAGTDDVEVADDDLSAEVDAADLPLDILEGLPAAGAAPLATAPTTATPPAADPEDDTAAPNAPSTVKGSGDKAAAKTSEKATLKLAKADPSDAAATETKAADWPAPKGDERFDDLDDEFFRETV